MTTPEPRIIGTDNLTVVDYWRARAETLEAELAQSQAKVERQRLRIKAQESAVQVALIAERALADKLAQGLREHGFIRRSALIEDLLEEHAAARSGAQGEDS